MQLLVVQQNVTIATTMNTNPTRMLPNAFQFKKVITDRVPQLKFNAQQVKQEAAATQHVKIVRKERFNPLRVKPPATTAPTDGAIPATDRPVATPYHRGRTP